MSKGRCIVYGGGGFIGSHLCEQLLNENYDVTVFDKLNFARRNITGFSEDIKIIEGDFNNESDLRNSLEGIDFVFHLVSSTLPESSNKNPEYDAETNLISSLRLFQECIAKKINKVVFLSSGGTVYGIPETIPIPENHSAHPICSYGIIKKAIEDYLYMFNKLYELNYNIFRLSNPYGERQNPNASQGAVPVFINKAINEEEITVGGNGDVVRDYIYVKDAVKVLVRSLNHEAKDKIYNLSSGEGHSINELIDLIRKVSGKVLKVKYLKGRKIDVPVNILDNTLVKSSFSWKPEKKFEDGLKVTYDYLKKMAEDDR